MKFPPAATYRSRIANDVASSVVVPNRIAPRLSTLTLRADNESLPMVVYRMPDVRSSRALEVKHSPQPAEGKARSSGPSGTGSGHRRKRRHCASWLSAALITRRDWAICGLQCRIAAGGHTGIPSRARRFGHVLGLG